MDFVILDEDIRYTDDKRQAWSMLHAGLRFHRGGLMVELYGYNLTDEVVQYWGGAAEQVSDFSLRQFQCSYREFLLKHLGRRAVPVFRLAQFAEYGLKSVLRRLAPGDRTRNRALARIYGERAKLQLKGRIEPAPPP